MQYSWDAGGGLCFDVCGYSRNNLVLFRLRHCHYLEFYQRTIDGEVLNDGLEFKDTHNPDGLADPLPHQLFSERMQVVVDGINDEVLPS